MFNNFVLTFTLQLETGSKGHTFTLFTRATACPSRTSSYCLWPASAPRWCSGRSPALSPTSCTSQLHAHLSLVSHLSLTHALSWSCVHTRTRSGRRFNCLLYAALYAASCMTKHFPNFWVLMVGRLLGGSATSILFSAFEAWLVCEHNRVRALSLHASCSSYLLSSRAFSRSQNALERALAHAPPRSLFIHWLHVLAIARSAPSRATCSRARSRSPPSATRSSPSSPASSHNTPSTSLPSCTRWRCFLCTCSFRSSFVCGRHCSGQSPIKLEMENWEHAERPCC